jgi:hypothetical protein
MRQELTLDAFVQRLKSKKLTDKRTGQNVQYEVNDAEALMRYLIFPDWHTVLRFMFVQLELEPD